MDPNWFYSTIAQSTAAIVGLLSAVLAARLQQQLIEVQASQHFLLEQLLAMRKRIVAQAAHLRHFARYARELAPAVSAAVERGESQIMINHEVDYFGGSRSGSKWPIPVNAGLELELTAQADSADRMAMRFDAISELDSSSSAAGLAAQIGAIASDSDRAEAFAQLGGHIGAADELASAVRLHEGRANVTGPCLVCGIVSWLCALGLLIPTGYLSAQSTSSKTWLLVAFSLGILAIPVYLALAIRRIRALRTATITPDTNAILTMRKSEQPVRATGGYVIGG